MWGYRRSGRVFDPDQGDFVTRSVYAPIVEDLRERMGYLPHAFDLLEYPEECERDNVIIVEGEHTPIRTKKQQRRLVDEMVERRRMGGRAAATDEGCYLFSGLTICGECGYSMTARRQVRGSKEYRYYHCSGRATGVDCSNKTYVREDDLYATVMGVLQEIARDPEAADLYLSGQERERASRLRDERDKLCDAIASLEGRRARWDEAYESEVIDLETYGDRLRDLEARQNEVEYRLQRVEAGLEAAEREDRRREDLFMLLDDVPALEDRRATKVFLRRVLEEVTLLDGEVEKIVL
jgi:hypothetical protein